jgi:hypothetical protein
MTTPMAVLGMEPVEVDTDEQTDPTKWTWEPKVKDADRLADALKASSNTTKNTYKTQLDHGENK